MQRTLHPDGNRIRTLRLERGWPQEQLADIADLSPRTIQRVESGGNASFETLRSIACAFEVDAKELLREQPAAAVSQMTTPTADDAAIAQPEVTITNHDWRFVTMSRGLWAALLATALAGLLYVPQFFNRSPVSDRTFVASNPAQPLPGLLPAAWVGPALAHQVQVRPQTLDVAKSTQRRRKTVRATADSPAPPVEMSPALPAYDSHLPHVENSVSTGADGENSAPGPQPAPQSVDEPVTVKAIVGLEDCDEATQLPAAGPDSTSKKIVDYRSLSDTAVRFGKRTSGFFSRLGATMKASF